MSHPWVQSARLKTLPLGISTVLIGYSIVNFQKSIDWVSFVCVLFLSMFLQILSNYANDYGDFLKGTDQNAGRTDRMLSSQKITPNAMKKALWVLSSFILVLGFFVLIWNYYQNKLSLNAFTSLLLLGFLSIAAAIFYTVGKKAYGYHGLGDVAVLLFFGIVPVIGIQFLANTPLKPYTWVGALGIGFLSTAVLNINNYRDLAHDAMVGKKTFAVILGEKRTLQYQRVNLVLGFSGILFSFGIYLYELLNLSGSTYYIEMFLLFGVFSPTAVFLARYYSEMRSTKPGDRDTLNLLLKHVSLSILLLSVAHFGLSLYVGALLR
jgi:1,4-dihydroxy-2-naphthoate polyprenyltransferase